MDKKTQVLLSYIESFERDYNNNLVGLKSYFDNLLANDNTDEIKQATRELQKEMKTYLQMN